MGHVSSYELPLGILRCKSNITTILSIHKVNIYLNPLGFCLLCPGKFLFGTVQHLLLHCEALPDKRTRLIELWSAHADEDGHLHSLLKELLQSKPEVLVQFLLDPSVVPQAVALCQQKLVTLSTLYYLTKTWCYGIHRRRLQLLGKFKKIMNCCIDYITLL